MSPPIYCHVSLVLDENGKKMSKRSRVTALRDALRERIATGQATKESLVERAIDGLRRDGFSVDCVRRCERWLCDVLDGWKGGG